MEQTRDILIRDDVVAVVAGLCSLHLSPSAVLGRALCGRGVDDGWNLGHAAVVEVTSEDNETRSTPRNRCDQRLRMTLVYRSSYVLIAHDSFNDPLPRYRQIKIRKGG